MCHICAIYDMCFAEQLKAYRSCSTMMFRSICVSRCKVFSNSFFVVVCSHYRNATYLSMGHTQCVGHQNVFREKLNSLASPFSYLFSTDTRITDSKASESSVQKTSATCPRKRKNDSGPVITLIGTDNNPTVLTFSEAEKIAKRRDLKLIKITDLDTKTQRPIYRLMTGAQYYEEDRKVRQEKSTKKEGGFKGEKLLTLSHRITPHDVSSRLKNISKWLSKNYEVRIVINGDKENMKCAEEVYDIIAESLKTEGRIVQKRQKGGRYTFSDLAT